MTPRIYADGSGWNGWRCGWCVVREGNKPKITECRVKMSTTETEYQAVIDALKSAPMVAEVLSDALSVVNQVMGVWPVRNPLLRPLLSQARALMAKKQVTLTWVPREANKAGKVMERF